MKKDPLETLIREVVILLYKPKKKTLCPGEEIIADYLHEKLSQREKEELERHLLTCESCLDQIMICNRIMREGGEREEKVPYFLLNQAISMFPEKKKNSLLENGRKFLVEILSKGEEIINILFPQSLAPLPVRGKEERFLPRSSRSIKNLKK